MTEIRPARMGDIPDIKALEDACFSPAWSAKQLSDELLCDDVLFLTAVLDGEITGFLIARRSGDDAELYQIAAAPAHRRRGTAAALLSRALDTARREGVSRFFLEVRSKNAPARALYEKSGFSEVGLRRDYYDSPKDDAVIMSTEVCK